MSAYSLDDPRDGRVRYVGRAKHPTERFKSHLLRSSRKNPGMGAWLAELAAVGLKPTLSILGDGTEAEWIVRLGPDLNISRGSARPEPPYNPAAKVRDNMQIRITKNEQIGLRTAATKAGLSVSDYVRKRLGLPRKRDPRKLSAPRTLRVPCRTPSKSTWRGELVVD